MVCHASFPAALMLMSALMRLRVLSTIRHSDMSFRLPVPCDVHSRQTRSWIWAPQRGWSRSTAWASRGIAEVDVSMRDSYSSAATAFVGPGGDEIFAVVDHLVEIRHNVRATCQVMVFMGTHFAVCATLYRGRTSNQLVMRYGTVTRCDKSE